MTTALVFPPTDCSGFIFTTPKPDKFWHQGRGVWLQAANRSIPSRSNGEITISLKFPWEDGHSRMLHPPLSRVECRRMVIFDCHLASNSSDTVHFLCAGAHE